MDRNPYVDRDLSRLYDACQRRAGELLQVGGRRSAEERAELARDTAYLLLALAPAIATGEHVQGQPERALQAGGGGFADQFRQFHQAAVRESRYRTLVRAANAAVGATRTAWIRDTMIEGERAYDLAMRSDDGLLRVLQHLESQRAAR